MPCLNQPLSQPDHVADWSLVHTLQHNAADAVVHKAKIKAVGWSHVRTDELWGLAVQAFSQEAPIISVTEK